jgi:site-specific DNA recombinase
MKTGIIYARVSTVKAGERDTPISSQISECREWATKNDIEVVEIFKDEGISGAKDRETRKGLNNAMFYAEKNKIDFFLVFDLSRFARSSEQTIVYKNALLKHKTTLVPVSAPLPEDKLSSSMITAIQSVMDEYYIEKNRVNVMRGLRENARLGYVRGHLPIGYKAVKEPNGKSRILKDDDTGRIYLQIVDMFLVHNKGSVEIAKLLNQNNYKNTRQTEFKKQAILGILKNRIYKGELVSDNEDENGESFFHEHLAYIDKDKWDTIQDELERRTKSVGECAAPSIFAGLLKCSCGASFRTDSTRKNGKPHFYYACKSRSGELVNRCNQERFKQDLIDKALLNAILDKIFTDEALANLEKYVNMELDYYKNEAMVDKPELENKLKEIETKTARLIKAVAEATLEASDVAEMLSAFKKEKKVILSRLDIVDENIDLSYRLTLTQEMIKELIAKVRNEQNVNVCRRLMKNIIDKIIVSGKNFSVYYSDKVLELQGQDGLFYDESSSGSGMVVPTGLEPVTTTLSRKNRHLQTLTKPDSISTR